MFSTLPWSLVITSVMPAASVKRTSDARKRS
jgi:hypothetical protein